VRLEVDYLADKGLVAAEAKVISPEVKRYRTTAAGRDFLAEAGL
jgi:DNA-binding PadR family transcriptional regulator